MYRDLFALVFPLKSHAFESCTLRQIGYIRLVVFFYLANSNYVQDREEDVQEISLSPWPNKIRTGILSSLKKRFNAEEAKKLWMSKGWTDGLCNTLLSNCNKIPLRIFVVDDSGMSNRYMSRCHLIITIITRIYGHKRWQENFSKC